MSREDLAGWLALNAVGALPVDERQVPPCVDCTAEYAAEMRALGRCNGEPGSKWPKVREEEPVGIPPALPIADRPAPVPRARESATAPMIAARR